MNGPSADPTLAAGPPYEVSVVDNLDHTRQALVSMQVMRPDVVSVVRTYPDVDELDLSRPPPDVLVLDYWLGRDDEPSVLHVPALKRWVPRVLLYTTEETPYLLRVALDAGVDGLCLKNDGMGALIEAIAAVGSGHLVFSGPLARAALEDDALGAVLTPPRDRGPPSAELWPDEQGAGGSRGD